MEIYNEYYTVDNQGYHFTQDAKENIPDDVYKLMEETFNSANEEFSKRNSEKIKKKSSSKINGPQFYPSSDESTKYEGYHSKTYYYDGNNWDVGDWLYLNDADTRWVVNVLIASSAFSYVLEKVLSLFPPTAGFAMSSDVISFMCGVGAAYLGNVNKGSGIYIRAYSGGVYVRAR